MTVLAADVGGTKTLVGLFEPFGRELIARRFETGSFQTLTGLFESFLALEEVQEFGRPNAIAVGVAGPVKHAVDGSSTAALTNTRHTIDSRELEERLGLAQARVINDWEAIAIAVGYAVDHEGLRSRLAPVELTAGLTGDPQGPIAALGPGTGLGHAIVLPDRPFRRVIPSEAGHMTLCACDDLDAEIIASLRSKFGGHLSVERLVSGSGLVTLYAALADLGVEKPSAAVDAEIETDRDGAPRIISTHALAGTDPLCVRALERFVSCYGAHAGNFALSCLATGGVALAGGISPKILPFLERGFVRAFVRKGRFEELLSNIPIHVITNPSVGLLGAGIEASRVA